MDTNNLAGWYATKLHAVDNNAASRNGVESQAICGAWVVENSRTEWHARRLELGVPKCKKCEKLLKKP